MSTTVGADVSIRPFHIDVPDEALADLRRRIAATKNIIQPPLPFDLERFQVLSNDILNLNQKLHYTYGGTIK